MEKLYAKLIEVEGMACNNKEFFIEYLTKNSSFSMLKRGRVLFNTTVERNKKMGLKKYDGVDFMDFIYASNANFRLQLALARVMNSVEHDIKSYIDEMYICMKPKDKRIINYLFNNRKFHLDKNQKYSYISVGDMERRVNYKFCEVSKARNTRNYYDTFDYCTFGELLRFFYYHFDKHNNLVFISKDSNNNLHKRFERSTLWNLNEVRNRIYHHNVLFNKVVSSETIVENTKHYNDSVSQFISFVSTDGLSIETIEINKLENCLRDNRYAFMIFYSVYSCISLLKRIDYNSNQEKGKKRVDYVGEDFIYNVTGAIMNASKIQCKDPWVNDMIYTLKACCKLFKNNCKTS